MPTISYSTPTDKNGQQANTLFCEAAGLPPNATVAVTISATGTADMSVTGTTDANGAISALVPITDPVIQAMLPMIGNGSADDAGSTWATSASDGVNTVAVTCSVA